jgi:AraC-like DNA-binding protein
MAQQTEAKPLPLVQPLASGAGWSVNEFRCLAGPGEPMFEERHDGFSIAAVVDGAFTYRGETGRAVLTPGSFLLGNSGACYACGHDHGRGDLCISLNVTAPLFEEIAASTAGTGGYRFPAAAAVAAGEALPAFMRLQLWATSPEMPSPEERVIALLEATLSHVSGTASPNQNVSARDMARVREAVAMIENSPEENLDLMRLSAGAGMSRYHFLRVFRRVSGVTPYQCLLAARLRRAAFSLAKTKEPITAVAYASGFGDLSTFNWRFRKTFGVTPSTWRQTH